MDMSSVDPLFRQRLKAVMTVWIDETGRYLKKAQEKGYLKKTVNTLQLAGGFSERGKTSL